MTEWPQFPVVYEINTWVWLRELSVAAGHSITLANVPEAELVRLASYGFDGLWLMGVWRRSPGGRKVAQEYPGLQSEYRRALPDFSPDDVVGSPYAVHNYVVDPILGGDDGLAELRSRLQAMDMRIMLDFVPNHMAVDHPWLATHPERLIQGGPDRLAREPGNYFQSMAGGHWRVFAHGRDPYFDGWTDTVQIDYRSAATRRVMTDILLSIAGRCDAVRCDMAMLVTQDVFSRTWGGQFEPARAEFWPCAITDVKSRYPGFLMMAEVYWDLEWELQQQGFDYTYDKRLYDRMLEGDAMAVARHLQAARDFQQHLARFIENHDEHRAVEAFQVEASRASAVLALSLPGLRLVHDGQLEGRRVKLPVQLARRPAEEPVAGLDDFYRRLLGALRHPAFHKGQWQLLEAQPGWVGNPTSRNILAHRWHLEDHAWVVAANLSQASAQCFVPLDLPHLAGSEWILHDHLTGQVYMRSGDDMVDRGLYVDLPAYGAHLFELRPS